MTSSHQCSKARAELLRGVDRVSGGAARHLEGCEACRSFAERFAVAHGSLRHHGARVTPDAGFSARVTAALPAPESGGDMTWAALRLLPAAVALALILGAWSWLRTSWPSDLEAAAPSDDVLSWVLESGS